ncbi:MAG: hypothetical protein U0Q16_01455 [Bryobacteraceae bacterium]
MSSADPGINRPFDRIVKAFNDEAPLILLEWMGLAEQGVLLETARLRPESAPTAVLPDAVLKVKPPGAGEFILHTEFELDYKANELWTIARQGGSLAFQHRIPVVTVLFLLRPDHVPEKIPDVAEDAVGETRLLHPFRTMRAWELDPEPVLRRNQLRLLPWIVLLKSSDEQVAKVGELLGRLGDEEAIVRFLTMGSLRYHRSQLEDMLGGQKMGLGEAIIRGSSLVREIREQDAEMYRKQVVAAREQGEAEGQREHSRRLLRNFLRSRYPGVETLSEIDRIADIDTLDSLIDRVASMAATREGIEAEIRAAAQ